jgi:hypothetical protein
MKWSNMNASKRLIFAELAKKLILKYPNDIRYLTIIVNKSNVASHIRTDSNKLYNYMIKNR